MYINSAALTDTFYGVGDVISEVNVCFATGWWSSVTMHKCYAAAVLQSLMGSWSLSTTCWQIFVIASESAKDEAID